MTTMLSKATGPDCPYKDCGCNATELIEAGNRNAAPWARYRCEHCHREFQINSREKACPECESLNTIATSSPGRIQRRRCRDCGATFKRQKNKSNRITGNSVADV